MAVSEKDDVPAIPRTKFVDGGIKALLLLVAASHRIGDRGLWNDEQFGADAGNPAVSAWNADPDHDGVINLLERAFNLPALVGSSKPLEPVDGTSGLPQITLSQEPGGPVLSICYVRRKASSNSGLVYVPQFAGNLQSTEWVAPTGPETVEIINFEWERVTVKDVSQGALSRRFGREKVIASE